MVAILNLVVAPGNKEIHFLLLWEQSDSFPLNFNIAAILDSVVALSNKEFYFLSKLWGSSVRSNIGPLFSNIDTVVAHGKKYSVLDLLSYQSVVLLSYLSCVRDHRLQFAFCFYVSLDLYSCLA